LLGYCLSLLHHLFDLQGLDVEHPTHLLSLTFVLLALLINHFTLVDYQLMQCFWGLSSVCAESFSFLFLSYEGELFPIFVQLVFELFVLHLEDCLFLAACFQFAEKRLLALSLFLELPSG
jgi:hypothetical protein